MATGLRYGVAVVLRSAFYEKKHILKKSKLKVSIYFAPYWSRWPRTRFPITTLAQ